MKQKITKGTTEWQMFTDFWMLSQEYWIAEDNDAYWDGLVDAAGEFARKYGTVMATNLMCALVDTKEKEFRQGGDTRVHYGADQGD